MSNFNTALRSWERANECPPDDPYQWAYDEADELIAALGGNVTRNTFDRVRDLVIDDLIEQKERSREP